MKGRFSIFLLAIRRWLLWVVGSCFSGCAPGEGYAIAAKSAATNLLLRVRHLSGESGGEMTLVNVGPGPCSVSSPSPCTGVVLRYDAQRQRVNPNHTAYSFLF